MDILQTVRAYVVDSFLFGDGSRLHDETSFLQEHVIDSLGILELIAFLEETYGIEIEDHELIPENMDSLANVAAFIERKLACAA